MVDRRFWVREGKRAEFEIVFGQDGAWAQFLRRARGYIVTEVKCESVSDGRFRVRDFWSGRRSFEIFREWFSEDFNQFGWQIAGELVEKEQFVGAYYEADGDDLVPA